MKSTTIPPIEQVASISHQPVCEHHPSILPSTHLAGHDHTPCTRSRGGASRARDGPPTCQDGKAQAKVQWPAITTTTVHVTSEQLHDFGELISTGNCYRPGTPGAMTHRYDGTKSGTMSGGSLALFFFAVAVALSASTAACSLSTRVRNLRQRSPRHVNHSRHLWSTEIVIQLPLSPVIVVALHDLLHLEPQLVGGGGLIQLLCLAQHLVHHLYTKEAEVQTQRAPLAFTRSWRPLVPLDISSTYRQDTSRLEGQLVAYG